MITAARSELKGVFSIGNNKRLHRDIQLLITRAKQVGLVNEFGNQKILLNDKSFDILSRISKFLIWINENETPNLRTFYETKKLIDDLLFCILNGETYMVFAFLCPSYKKGIGAIGFNREIGETTKRGIKITNTVYKLLKSLGVAVKCQIIFSDLVIENYDKIFELGLLSGMKSNIESTRLFTQATDPEIFFNKLSEFSEITEIMPLKGIDNIPNRISNSTYQLVLKRNINFYKAQFGWEDKQIIERTNILACSYPVLGDFFRAKFSRFLFVYTANSLERAKMYQGEQYQLNSIAIFYPRKIKFSRK
ncbi:MAG: hypothetical protein ABIA74_01070 [bacterium]